LIAWREGDQVFPYDRYKKLMNRPDLVAATLQGKRKPTRNVLAK